MDIYAIIRELLSDDVMTSAPTRAPPSAMRPPGSCYEIRALHRTLSYIMM